MADSRGPAAADGSPGDVFRPAALVDVDGEALLAAQAEITRLRQIVSGVELQLGRAGPTTTEGSLEGAARAVVDEVLAARRQGAPGDAAVGRVVEELMARVAQLEGELSAQQRQVAQHRELQQEFDANLSELQRMRWLQHQADSQLASCRQHLDYVSRSLMQAALGEEDAMDDGANAPDPATAAVVRMLHQRVMLLRSSSAAPQVIAPEAAARGFGSPVAPPTPEDQEIVRLARQFRSDCLDQERRAIDTVRSSSRSSLFLQPSEVFSPHPHPHPHPYVSTPGAAVDQLQLAVAVRDVLEEEMSQACVMLEARYGTPLVSPEDLDAALSVVATGSSQHARLVARFRALVRAAVDGGRMVAADRSRPPASPSPLLVQLEKDLETEHRRRAVRGSPNQISRVIESYSTLLAKNEELRERLRRREP